MSLTPRNTVTLGTPHEVNNRAAMGAAQALINTFNTPINSWNTIVFKKVIGGNAGDTLRLHVLKGSLPDDPNDPNDDNEAHSRLDQADLIDTADVVLDANIPSGGLFDVQFDFNTTFSQGNLGPTYTVVFEQLDSGGNYVKASLVICQSRTNVSNFTSPLDTGWDGDLTNIEGHNYPAHIGGAGNFYYIINQNFLGQYTLFTGQAMAETGAFGSTGHVDNVMPLALFERSPYGTSRNLTGSLTSSTSLNII